MRNYFSDLNALIIFMVNKRCLYFFESKVAKQKVVCVQAELIAENCREDENYSA